eukprot:5436568-Pyramimonas_sp.AAC.1
MSPRARSTSKTLPTRNEKEENPKTINKRQRKRRQKATIDLERAQPPSTVACVFVAPPHSATLVATPIIATHEATPVATVDVVMKRPRKAVAPEEQPRKRDKWLMECIFSHLGSHTLSHMRAHGN